MKKIILAGAFLSTFVVSAQQGIGTKAPDKSSMLELKSDNRGLLIPRVELTAIDAAGPVANPANSLLVYNTASVNGVTPGYYYWNVNKWVRLANSEDVKNASTQSVETVKGDNTTILVTPGAETTNKTYTVKIKPAEKNSGEKVLKSTNGIVEWGDASAGSIDTFKNNENEETAIDADKRVVEDTDGDLTDSLKNFPKALIIKVMGGTGIKFPEASLYPGRLISINNFAGGNRNIDGIASLSKTIRVASNFLVWSDGQKWWVLSGRLG